MATKSVELQGIGTVTLYKRKGARSIRLSITAKGEVRITLPHWVAYEAGATFAKSKQDWITEQLTNRPSSIIAQGQHIGKSHRIMFEASPVIAKTTSRVDAEFIRIVHPASHKQYTEEVQEVARKASIRALRVEAEELLPPRLAKLAAEHFFSYRSVQVKQLTGRWGSCDNNKNITLNLFLMQVPWNLIDYVLMHELTHTKVMRHGPDFWRVMEEHMPGAKKFRSAMRDYQPTIAT